MGIITIEKANHLFWLGRYTERITGCTRNFMKCYDKMIDVDEDAYIEFLNRLGIDPTSYDKETFATKYVYDPEAENSIVSIINHAFDNAVILREEITGDTLAYIDLAKHVLERAEHDTLILELQKVLDDVNAFFGSAYDTLDEVVATILKLGKRAERLDLQVRFGVEKESGANRSLEHAKVLYHLKSLNQRFEIPGLKEVGKALEWARSEEEIMTSIMKITQCFDIR